MGGLCETSRPVSKAARGDRRFYSDYYWSRLELEVLDSDFYTTTIDEPDVLENIYSCQPIMITSYHSPDCSVAWTFLGHESNICSFLDAENVPPSLPAHA